MLANAELLRPDQIRPTEIAGVPTQKPSSLLQDVYEPGLRPCPNSPVLGVSDGQLLFCKRPQLIHRKATLAHPLAALVRDVPVGLERKSLAMKRLSVEPRALMLLVRAGPVALGKLDPERDHEEAATGFRTCSQKVRKLVGTVLAEVRSVALSIPSSLARYMST